MNRTLLPIRIGFVVVCACSGWLHLLHGPAVGCLLAARRGDWPADRRPGGPCGHPAQGLLRARAVSDHLRPRGRHADLVFDLRLAAVRVRVVQRPADCLSFPPGAVSGLLVSRGGHRAAGQGRIQSRDPLRAVRPARGRRPAGGRGHKRIDRRPRGEGLLSGIHQCRAGDPPFCAR